MSEIDSNEPDVLWDDEAPKKKGRFPRWLVVGCGCGCLVIVLALVALGLFIGKLAKEGRDPDVQWPKIQRALPFEERPTDLELQVGLQIGLIDFETYVLNSADGAYVATIQYHPKGDPAAMDMIFDPSGVKVPFGLGQPKEAEARTLTIQGRETRALFYRSLGGEGSSEAAGPGVRIDASGDHGFTLVELRLTSRGATEFPEERIQEFFSHFEFGDS